MAAQLFTVREFVKTPGQISQTLSRIKSLGYGAVELSFPQPVDAPLVKRFVDEAGLEICGVHNPYERLRDDTEAVLEEHRTYGCPSAVVAAPPREYWGSLDGYLRFAEEASEVGRRLAEEDVDFTYHNHSFEFERYGGRTGFDVLVEETDPETFRFELDCYWLQHAGVSPVRYIRLLAGRVEIVHLKDMAIEGWQQHDAEVGEGNIYWPEVFEACREAGVDWCAVEQDETRRDPFESLGLSLRNLEKMGLVTTEAL